MKTVLLSTSSLWNCGDEFIRDGVLNLLNLKPEVRTIWWNRAYGVRCAYANDVKLNVKHCDYFIVAGTPTWLNNTEYIYKYCLKKDIPVALIGVGTSGAIWNFRQKDLLHKLAKSGLVEVCMVRDEFAFNTLSEYGFDNVVLALDPAFFLTPLSSDDKVNILGWRDWTFPKGVRLRDCAKRIVQKIAGSYRQLRSFATWYDGFMQGIFHQLASPKLVTVHDNREIRKAEVLFGKEYVFYSTDYRELLRVYSRGYIGSRIHGAIPSLIHGACVNVLYFTKKARVLENSAEILSKSVDGIERSVKVLYLKNRTVNFPKDFVDSAPDRKAISLALEQEKRHIREKLKRTAVLKAYIQ